MDFPADLKYTREHEWARQEGGEITVGITSHAQAELGDIVFLELPEVGAQVEQGKTFGVVESVKAVSDLYSPVSGQVVRINADLVDAPERVRPRAATPHIAATRILLSNMMLFPIGFGARKWRRMTAPRSHSANRFGHLGLSGEVAVRRTGLRELRRSRGFVPFSRSVGFFDTPLEIPRSMT